ncbi:MAG: hypothetical protein ACXVC1_02750, partial [Tumebacillaceae bacterium]
QAGDRVTVSGATMDDNPLATATVEKGKTSAVAHLKLHTGGGSLNITVTRVGKTESPFVSVNYDAENSIPLQTSQITTVNRAGYLNSSVKVTGLSNGDEVRVYDSLNKGKLLGIGTALPVEATDGTVLSYTATVSLTLTSVMGGNVYVSVTNGDRNESTRVQAHYGAQPSHALTGEIKVTNNVGTQDQIDINGLVRGDVIRIYANLTDTKPLYTSSAVTGSNKISIRLALPNSQGGTLYISVKTGSLVESDRVAVTYGMEGPSQQK